VRLQERDRDKVDKERLYPVLSPDCDYIALGGRPAKQHRLGPVYEISFCATGMGMLKGSVGLVCGSKVVCRLPAALPGKMEAQGKKTQSSIILHDYYTLSEDRYANVAKNKHRLYNNQKQAREAATGAPPAATDAAAAAPLSLPTPAAPTTPKIKRKTLTSVATPPTVEQKRKIPRSSCKPESFLTCPIGYEYVGPLPRKTGLVQGEAEKEKKVYLASIYQKNFETNALYPPGDDHLLDVLDVPVRTKDNDVGPVLNLGSPTASSAWALRYLPEEELEETEEEIEEKEEPKLRALDLPEELKSLALDLPLEPLLLEQQVALLDM